MLPKRDIAMETDHAIKAHLSAFFALKFPKQCNKTHQKLLKIKEKCFLVSFLLFNATKINYLRNTQSIVSFHKVTLVRNGLITTPPRLNLRFGLIKASSKPHQSNSLFIVCYKC